MRRECNMQSIRFINEDGDFILEEAQKAPSVYMPLVNGEGMMSSITPFLAGDCKADQNTFLLEPASEQTLTENRASRNFWIIPEEGTPWSACGQSAGQMTKRFTQEENCTLRGGLLWQSVSRTNAENGLHAEILSFVPSDPVKAEIMQTILKNEGDRKLTFRCVVAIPLYGRSADNIRDHRHVTSLLQRGEAEHYGVCLHPTLTCDERGHRPGSVTYRVWAASDTGEAPAYMIPLLSDFVGTGTLDWPQAVVCPDTAAGRVTEKGHVQGGEMIAGLFFDTVTLEPGQSRSYQTVLTINDDPAPYLSAEGTAQAFERTRQYWQKMAQDRFSLGLPEFTQWMKWVSVQPVLRRICGCSFLPHHDYGRGGRGWRDLWQDSLALLLNDPSAVRTDMLSYFAGVRPDGTNATIIGARPGEFKADRNNIPRVWMDHGFWPLLTTSLYLDESGDPDFLWQEQRYFNDQFAIRGEGARPAKTLEEYHGTVFEHLLIETVTAFFDVGEHGNIRLRGADWNDGLDMAAEKGESVAFTAAYAYGLELLSGMLEQAEKDGRKEIKIAGALWQLMQFAPESYGTPALMTAALEKYCEAVYADMSPEQVSTEKLAEKLQKMSAWIRQHIRSQEWTGDHAGQEWFNSYYDNHGQQTDGVCGDRIRMMLTGQVFTLLSGTASQEQAEKMIRAADRYLYDSARGGYCLNTDFGEVKLDLGRMFGFAYGSKENGAVFCHMAVMFAYALYSRGFAMQGRKALRQLYLQSMDFSRSMVLPGIPEYFDAAGRGMYPYLTGAASWYVLTLRTQIFGIRGQKGQLVLEPKLMADQFDGEGNASISCAFAGKRLEVTYQNPKKLEWKEYRIGRADVNGQEISVCGNQLHLTPEQLNAPDNEVNRITVELEAM